MENDPTDSAEAMFRGGWRIFGPEITALLVRSASHEDSPMAPDLREKVAHNARLDLEEILATVDHVSQLDTPPNVK